MILYYSTKFHFIIINSYRVIGRGHFRHPPPPPEAAPPSKSPGGIGLKWFTDETSSIYQYSTGYGPREVVASYCVKSNVCKWDLLLNDDVRNCEGKYGGIRSGEDFDCTFQRVELWNLEDPVSDVLMKWGLYGIVNSVTRAQWIIVVMKYKVSTVFC